MEKDTYQVAKQYSDLLKINLIPDSKAVEEAIDETIIRLEEYSALISLVSAGSNVDKYKDFLKRTDFLYDLFDRINRLEQFIIVVRNDVDKVEKLLDAAERKLGKSKEGPLQSLLKPFFRRSNTVPGPSLQPEQTNFVAPELFKTKEYFPDS